MLVVSPCASTQSGPLAASTSSSPAKSARVKLPQRLLRPHHRQVEISPDLEQPKHRLQKLTMLPRHAHERPHPVPTRLQRRSTGAILMASGRVPITLKTVNIAQGSHQPQILDKPHMVPRITRLRKVMADGPNAASRSLRHSPAPPRKQPPPQLSSPSAAAESPSPLSEDRLEADDEPLLLDELDDRRSRES